MQPPTAPILIIEPSPSIRQLLAGCCEARHAPVAFVDTVGQALSAIEERKPALVLSALELPGLSACSLVAALRNSPGYRAIPIGLVSSSQRATERIGSYAVDRVLPKNAELAAALGRFFDDVGVACAAAAPVALNGRVLLVEDAVVCRLVFARLLHVAGADVTVAGDGAEAVSLATSQRFDLILMDIEMPVMDGKQAVRLLREGGVKTPILALTGRDAADFRAEAAQLGFNGVLEKHRNRDAVLAACAPLLARPAPRRA